MSDLSFTGNHVKGSRPVLSFQQIFNTKPHLQLFKELLKQVFNIPKNYKSKPFFDHVLSFSLCDGKIWIRNYQVVIPPSKQNLDALCLNEVGPRFSLQPI